jgi:hypothetical protein
VGVIQFYDPYEDVSMKKISLPLIGKAKKWYDIITPGEITTCNTFQGIFIRRFTKEDHLVSLYDQLYHFRREPGEYMRNFNDRFNTLMKHFPQSLVPLHNTILQSYTKTLNDPYGSLIGKNYPTTLMEAKERACQINENLTSSHYRDEIFPQDTV